MKTYWDEYKSKLVSTDEAIKTVKSGDFVHFGEYVMNSQYLDEALAKRKDELSDVMIRMVCVPFQPQTILSDPEGKSFYLHETHFSGAVRKLADQRMPAYFVPMLYSDIADYYWRGYFPPIDVLLYKVGPMDEHGFFNLGPSNSGFAAFLDTSKKVIVEVNQSVPNCLGGCREAIHISDIDMIVEGDNRPLMSIPAVPASDADKKIASLLMNEIEDGSCLQLGIGGLPNIIGKMISESDLKDLGIHTEMLCDSMVDMYETGRVTGNKKTIDRKKMVYTFAMGSQKLYDFLDNNHACASYPCDYTNNPEVIALNDKVISINGCLEVDLYGQVCSESSGPRQISGTGGQYDFVMGGYKSKGGKTFLCMSSTVAKKDGTLESRIKPLTTYGSIVTIPRSISNYIATEYGIVRLKGLSTWQRAEALIGIAHPQFRDELVKSAEENGIWRKSNKLC